ncbi:uncharacterized protein LOC108218414 [Daucus carota subsp. sativus]|uniref:uncharacterized protein LOC108218414 n=1 Tax=Daucus carota subsp. sativus TaxID=79200 RepID=UPI0007F02113|nr:PREDICTED: uncharacterized protein LOC108218414 [Daucus carota subsp. sativus]
MTTTLKNAPNDYKHPSADRARTSLLDDCKRKIEKDRGSMFLYVEDFFGVEKTGKEIANFLLKSSDEIGPTNVLQVVIDNASSCFAVAFPWMRNTYIRGKNIVECFINHAHAHAIFRSHSALELLKVAKTRFGSHHLLLNRLTQCREALATTVIVRSCKDWVNYRDENARDLGKEITSTIKDEEFWEEVDDILAINRPTYRMIKFGDNEGQKMEEIYERMYCMIREINDIMKNNKHQSDHGRMNDILFSRWEKMNVPMHCLGFALNPYSYDVNYLQSLAPGGKPRPVPNCNLEVVQGVLKAFDKIGEDEEERRILHQQIAKSPGRRGIFGTLAVKVDDVTMTPISWWSTWKKHLNI